MIAAHFPALQVVLPLVAAPVCALLPGARSAWVLTTAVAWASFGIALALLGQVLNSGTLSYPLGNWPPPWGIEYRIDLLNAYLLMLVAGIGALVATYARRSIEHHLVLPGPKGAWFYTAYLLCLTGLLGIVITGDIFNVFVFLEISSLSSYVLISLGRDRRALTAAYQYLIMGTIGATFYLIGVGFLYVMTGTLNMADLAQRLPVVGATRTVQVAFAFLTVGLALKLALFPLHLWLPNAYTYAPEPVTAFLAATATKVALYLLLRVSFTVFGPVFSTQTQRLDTVLLALAVAGIVSASVIAVFQTNVKRLLAYSSIAQIGYMLLGVSLVSITGLTAALVHLFNHALMKGALFMALGCVAFRVGMPRLSNMAGLARVMPWTMAAFVIGGLSLIGVPWTAGFVSKWYLLAGLLERDLWLVAALVLFTSLLAVVYVWRVVEAAYFQPLPDAHRDVREAPLALLLPTWTLALANLYFGVETSFSVGLARAAAESLLPMAGP